MTPKIKNILIFVLIGVVMVWIYVFFIKGTPEDTTALTSTAGSMVDTTTGVTEQNSEIAQDFLSLLLNIKSITLQDSIFADPAFISLKDSSIELVPDGNEGRPNPFAPIGSDVIAVPVTSETTATTTPTSTTTPTTIKKEVKTGTTTTTTTKTTTTPAN